ncbi:methionine ABC transporter ATP-binding protein [Rickettsiales bacterium LUAb2]
MIILNNITKFYKSLKLPSLNNISLNINKGDIFGIIGYSGAGKSTILRTINLLEKPNSGEVIVNKIDLTKLSPKELSKQRKNIGMIFQHSNLLSSKNVYKNIALPLELNKTPKKDIKDKVLQVLNLVGLDGYASKYPSQLSGGQKQRVGIARALVQNPSVLLCDEPTSALDVATTHSILELIQNINKMLDITVIIITHDINVVQTICNKMAVIHKGEIVENGEVRTIFNNPQSPVTKLLLSHIVDDTSDCDYVISLNVTKKTNNLNFMTELVADIKTNITIINSCFYHEDGRLHGNAIIKLKLNDSTLSNVEQILLNYNLEITEVTKC